MASSGSADEDFQSRVARIFGSLAFSRSSSSSVSMSSAPASRQQSGSVWSLSDSDVEKREWKREQLTSYDRDEMPCASSFEDLLRQQKISSTEDDRGEGANEDFDDEWSIRASMGLDRTLDDEEEEDEYDKLALGKENSCEGSSIKDALSKSSGVRTRDPRANHVAAKIRLKEDEIQANKFSKCGNNPSRTKEHRSEESSKTMPPKPILKRKENNSVSEGRTSKRVRFDFISEETTKKPEDTSSKTGSNQSKTGALVPDYLLNPSKYTCYSFDSACELNEKSPTDEYLEIPLESESFKKVSFIPQKKTKVVKEEVVAGQVSENERPRDEETEIRESGNSSSFQRNGRQYRAKLSLDERDV